MDGIMDGSTVFLGIVYVGFALFYAGVLLLTERSASRYVRGEAPQVNDRASVHLVRAEEPGGRPSVVRPQYGSVQSS